MSSALVSIGPKHKTSARESSQSLIQGSAGNELIFAVVGHVGSGTSAIANDLKQVLTHQKLVGGSYDTEILKASELLASQDAGASLVGARRGTLEYATRLQDLGDALREKEDHAAVARLLILRIRQLRAQKLGRAEPGTGAVTPDGTRRAYILDSIRHPMEIELLRNVYQSAFVLVGVVCEEAERLRRLRKKYEDEEEDEEEGTRAARAFMERDAQASEKHGQRVSDAFHLSDIFLDNSANRQNPEGDANEHWGIPDELHRLVKLITHAEVVRPRAAETAMHAAYGAQLRSACLSRQVGASLVDGSGNLLSTGTNEVPRAGGGVYGESFDVDDDNDHRCAFKNKLCSSTREQNELIEELAKLLVERKATTLDHEGLFALLKGSRLRQLLEFSRAVHAEMDALLRAAREGTSTVGGRMFVTTYPCHYCARHIVAAGVDEVQYIEPYPKSRATKLHADAITTEPVAWRPPSQGGAKVLFRPFVGVAPRLYRRAFLKDRDLKDGATGNMSISQPEWATPWHLGRVSYVELEAMLAKKPTDAP